MATYNKFNDFSNQLVRGTHNFASNTFKIMLTNTAPVATNTVFANLTDIAAGNGYTAGGTALTSVTITPSGTTATISAQKVVFTASGGTLPSTGTFRYAVLYNDTAASKNLIAWWDYASSTSLNTGETFSVLFSNVDGVGNIVAVGP